jgi:hypothetical protein
MLQHYRLHHPLRILLLTSAALTATLFLPRAAHPQDFDRSPAAGHVTCSSDGGRVFCDADTSGGVQLERQMYQSRGCVRDQTWGVTDRGIWVDQGCSGEFVLAGAAPGPRGFVSRIEPGTMITVRTNEWIDARRHEDRVYGATVEQNVIGENRRVAIPRGSPVELMVREAPDGDLVLDLNAVNVNGRVYSLEATPQRIESEKGPGLGENRSTTEHVGGGALIGSIVGAIAGGGKGAAIGAGAGAAAGAGEQMLTRGHRIHVPPESVLTFRMEQPLVVRNYPRG